MAAASDEFRLLSTAISHESKLPRKYTAEGQGASKKMCSPPFEWYNVPQGTKSLAMVVQDLDSNVVPWTNWVVVNIPPSLKGLPEGFSGKGEELGGDYAEIQEGHNDNKVPGWGVPMLPEPGHRFEFKLYALDNLMHLGNKATKEKLIDAVEGHVLGEAVLISVN